MFDYSFTVHKLIRIEKLQALLKDEKENAEAFEPLPRRFLETSKVLLDMCVTLSLEMNLVADLLSAADDVSQPVQLRSLLKDLREVRQAKIRIGLQSEGVMRGSYLQASSLPIDHQPRRAS